MLHVNFDPLIVRLLREVKYFLLLGLRVPESALEIFSRGEVTNKPSSEIISRENVNSGTLFHIPRPAYHALR